MKMNLTALRIDYDNKSGEQFNSINKFASAALLHIIVQYFSKWSNYFVLTMSCRKDRSCDFYHDMIYKMFNQWNEWPRQIVAVKRNDNIKVPGLRHYNMIFTDSYKAFKECELHFYTADYNNNEYYYIFLQTPDHLIFDEMQKIFEYCWLHYLINCIIQIQSAEGEILFYTYFPFTAEKYCGKTEPILVNEFNGTSLVHKELFPKKLENLHGCPLKAALWHVPPYLYLSTDSNNASYISGGFEGKLLLELAKKLNFTLEIKIPENGSERGTMLDNGSLTGALKMLKDRTADISLGSFRQNTLRRTVATSTLNYYQTKLALVTIAETYRLNSLQTLLFPFTRESWLFLFAVNLTAFFALTKLKHISLVKITNKATLGFLDMLLSIFGMPTIYNPTKNFSRILMTTWLLYTLIIRTMYQALLYHLIRARVMDNVPQSLEELVRQQYTIVVNLPAVKTYKKMPLMNSLKMIGLNTSSSLMTLKYLEKLPLDKAFKIAASVPLDILQYYALTSHKAGKFKVLPVDIINFEACMYMTKHTFLSDQFNELLLWIRGYGLMNAWSHQEVDSNYYNSKHLEGDHIFGVQQLQMAFVAVLGGYIMAILVFISELLCEHVNYHKFVKKL